MIAIELNLSCSIFEFWLYSYPAKKPAPLIEEDLAFSYICVPSDFPRTLPFGIAESLCFYFEFFFRVFQNERRFFMRQIEAVNGIF